MKRIHFNRGHVVEKEIPDEDRTKPNPEWREANDGECVGAGFDEKGIYQEFYVKATKSVRRVYRQLHPNDQ